MLEGVCVLICVCVFACVSVEKDLSDNRDF